jgi:proteic killer suppression protein
MIKSFRHKGLKKFFLDGIKKGIQVKHANRLELILDTLNAAHKIEDMNFPGSGLHLLEPKKANVWAVKVSGNWRVTFRFEDGDAYDVQYIDYH